MTASPQQQAFPNAGAILHVERSMVPRVRRNRAGWFDEPRKQGKNNSQNSPLEQDLATVFRLESQSLQLGISLLIPALALAVFLLFELENFFEWSLGH